MKIYLTLLLLLLCRNNFAQENLDAHPLLSSRFLLNIGIYNSAKTANFGVNSSDVNEIINFNESLNLRDKQSTFIFNFNWRFSEKGNLSAEIFSIRNNYMLELSEDIEWREIIFKLGLNVEIGLRTEMYRVLVGKTFSKGLKHEFGIGMGIHALNFGFSIRGNVFISENEVNFERRSVSFLAPLPNIGFWYFYAPNSKLGFSARLEWFSISIGNYGGSLWNINPAINYQVFKNIGFGLSYKYFDLIAKVDKSDLYGKVKMNFQGPMFTISANF